MNPQVIFTTINITSAIFLITYTYQLYLLVKKLCTPNIPMTKKGVIKDIIPWFPYFSITLLLNLGIFIVNIILGVIDRIIFSINKFKILE